MTAEQHLTLTIHIVPGGQRGQFRGEVTCVQTGHMTAIASRQDLSRFVEEQVDLHAPLDDTNWTRLLTEASQVEREDDSRLERGA